MNVWRGVTGIEYPLAPGAPGDETWGEVVEVAVDVATICVGQTVTGLLWNGFAELGVGRAADLVVVPDGFNAAGEPLACAMNVVRRSAIRSGDRVAVVGFGYLAALFAQLLPEQVGAWVAISRRQDSRALALRLGAEAAYDFAEIPSDLWDSFAVVVEAAGVQQTLDYATWLTGDRRLSCRRASDGERTELELEGHRRNQCSRATIGSVPGRASPGARVGEFPPN